MTLALVITKLGHRLRREQGSTFYKCDHCGGVVVDPGAVKDWCNASLGKARRSR